MRSDAPLNRASRDLQALRALAPALEPRDFLPARFARLELEYAALCGGEGIRSLAVALFPAAGERRREAGDA